SPARLRIVIQPGSQPQEAGGEGTPPPPSPIDRRQQASSDEGSTRNKGSRCWNLMESPLFRFRHVNPCSRHIPGKGDHRWHSSVSSAGNVAVIWGISLASRTGSIP